MSKKILSKNAFIVIAGLALIAGCGQQAPPQTANIRDAAEASVQEGESNASGYATQTPGLETDAAKGQTDTVKTPGSADDAGVRKAFKQLSDDMKKKDYKSASLLITQNGLENFVASQFIGAAMMSQGFQGVPGKKFAVIKKYKLDSLSIDELMGLDGEQASRKIHKLVLSRFKDNDDMLAALRSLTKRGVYLRLKNYYHCTTGGRLNKKWLSR